MDNRKWEKFTVLQIIKTLNHVLQAWKHDSFLLGQKVSYEIFNSDEF